MPQIPTEPAVTCHESILQPDIYHNPDGSPSFDPYPRYIEERPMTLQEIQEYIDNPPEPPSSWEDPESFLFNVAGDFAEFAFENRDPQIFSDEETHQLTLFAQHILDRIESNLNPESLSSKYAKAFALNVWQRFYFGLYRENEDEFNKLSAENSPNKGLNRGESLPVLQKVIPEKLAQYYAIEPGSWIMILLTLGCKHASNYFLKKSE